jgi:hypothetical protein
MGNFCFNRRSKVVPLEEHSLDPVIVQSESYPSFEWEDSRNPIPFTALDSYSNTASFNENIKSFVYRYRYHLGRKFVNNIFQTLDIWEEIPDSILFKMIDDRLRLISNNKPKRLKRSVPEYIRVRQYVLYKIVYLQMVRDLCIILYYKTNTLHTVYHLLDTTKEALVTMQQFYRNYNKRREQERLLDILRETIIPQDVQRHIIGKFFINMPKMKL